MFTGLVERTGKVVALERQAKSPTLIVDPGTDFERSHGDSIAINGVCLSDVSEQGHPAPLVFHVSEETFSRTSLGGLKPGDLVNLERSMKVSDRLGGHIVLGHVDGLAEVIKLESRESFWYLEIRLPKSLSKYTVEKGSIALDGVSLTINSLRDDKDASVLSFMLVPVTWQTTRFQSIVAGQKLNVEVDVLAKHLERLVSVSKNSNECGHV